MNPKISTQLIIALVAGLLSGGNIVLFFIFAFIGEVIVKSEDKRKEKPLEMYEY